MILNKTAPRRFWAKVDKTGECWLWTGRRDKDGYGRFRPNGKSCDRGAHRVSFVLHGGTIPDGAFVCHSCDNPPCVNPAHLWLGTAQDNSDDMVSKGRQGVGNTALTAARGDRNGARTKPESRARGERNGSAVLTEEHVRLIRAAYAGGESQGSIGRRMDIPQAHISRIVRRTLWAHVH